MVSIPSDGGVVQGATTSRIPSAISCTSFSYGLNAKWLVYLLTKNTIFKVCDGMLKDTFRRSLRRGIQGRVRSRRADLRALAYRRDASSLPRVGGRLRVGLQEV